MANVKISIINACTVLQDADIQAVVPVLQTQVTRDFAPPWGVDADLDFVPRGQNPPPGHWWLAVLDNSDTAGALGYHDVTPEGLPLGKIFAGTDIANGYQWTVTASHELLEMLGDPAINLTAMVQPDNQPNVVGRLYAYEVCDACEADQYGYKINNVLVSDFVYPSWFEPFRQAGTQFDYQNQITAALALLPGGYISVYDINAGTGWQQITMQAKGRESSTAARAPVGSRRERRRVLRKDWIVSNPKPIGRAAGGRG